MSKRYSGKSFKDSSVKKKHKLFEFKFEGVIVEFVDFLDEKR